MININFKDKKLLNKLITKGKVITSTHINLRHQDLEILRKFQKTLGLSKVNVLRLGLKILDLNYTENEINNLLESKEEHK